MKKCGQILSSIINHLKIANKILMTYIITILLKFAIAARLVFKYIIFIIKQLFPSPL